ncbi:MAG: hypothetical protein AAF432_02805 [Planctomycetota bacterium]
MSHRETSTIRERLVGDGTEITLPSRDLGRLRLIALIPLAIAVVLVIDVIVDVSRSLNSGFAFSAALVVDGVQLIAAIIFLRMASYALKTKTRFHINSTGITVHDHFGPKKLRRTHAGPFSDIEILRADDDTSPEVPAFLQRLLHNVAGLTLIKAGTDGRRDADRFITAVAFPPDVVEALAPILVQNLQRADLARDALLDDDYQPRSASIFEDTDAARRSTDHDELADAEGDVRNPPSLPDDSTITVACTAGELAIVVPARGYGAGKRGEMAFAFIWCALVLVFDIVLVCVVASNVMQRGVSLTGAGSVAIPAAVLGLFTIVGVFFARSAIHQAHARTMLDIVGGALVIAEQSPMRKRLITIDGTNIASIRVGPSGIEINDEPLLDLQISMHAAQSVGTRSRRKKLHLLRERSDEELRWLATTLQHALQLDDSTD